MYLTKFVHLHLLIRLGRGKISIKLHAFLKTFHCFNITINQTNELTLALTLQFQTQAPELQYQESTQSTLQQYSIKPKINPTHYHIRHDNKKCNANQL